MRADPDILEHIRDALDCGADDIVGTGISNPELTHRIQIHQDHLRTNAILREILSRLRFAMRRATAAREVALRSGTTRA